MQNLSKRIMVTLMPEWEDALDKLKKDKFYNDSQASMFRYLISLGLEKLQEDKDEQTEQNFIDD